MIDKVDKKILKYSIFPILVLLSFLVSLLFFLIKQPGKRYNFVFPSTDAGKYVIETRCLPKKPTQGEIRIYIDEILLGSYLERTKLLFSSGTKVKSCFVRNGTLYLNLTPHLLSTENNTISIEQGFYLLEKNIYKNFSKIKNIEFFVDNKLAYEKNKSYSLTK